MQRTDSPAEDPSIDPTDGASAGPLVIALHGACANGAAWIPLRRELPPGVELWAPDLPGHGSRATGEPFTLEAALALIAELVATATPRRPVLAGDSLGGYLALAAAARIPQGRLGGVVAGGCTWSMHGVAGALARLTDLPAALAERIVGPARANALLASAARRAADPETGRALAAAGMRAAARGESLRELRGLDLRALAARITVPVVFVNGRFDYPTRAGERGLLARAVHSRLLVADRCGHGVSLFAPGVFARACELAFGGDAGSTPP